MSCTNVKLITTHVPTGDQFFFEKYIFYDKLNHKFRQILTYNNKMVIRGFKVNVGTEEIYKKLNIRPTSLLQL